MTRNKEFCCDTQWVQQQQGNANPDGDSTHAIGTPSRYLAKTICWNACKILLLLLCNRQLVVAGHLGGGCSAPVNNGPAVFKQLNLDLGRVSGDGGMGDAGPA